jgi:hypothetical protein
MKPDSNGVYDIEVGDRVYWPPDSTDTATVIAVDILENNTITLRWDYYGGMEAPSGEIPHNPHMLSKSRWHEDVEHCNDEFTRWAIRVRSRKAKKCR